MGIANTDAEETGVLFPTLRGGFYAFDTSDGSFLWKYIVNPAPLGTAGGSFSTAGVDPNLHLMFVGTSNATTPPAGPHTSSLLAIDYRTGELRWSQQYQKNDVYSTLYPCGPDHDVGSSPNLFTVCKDGKKICAVGANNKADCYRAFKRKDGKPL